MRKYLKTYLVLLLICSCGYSSLYKTNNELLNYRINIIVKTETKYSKDKQTIKNYLYKKLSKKELLDIVENLPSGTLLWSKQKENIIEEYFDKIYNKAVTICHKHHLKLHSIYGKKPKLITAEKS